MHNIEDLLNRIEELEARVRKLESPKTDKQYYHRQIERVKEDKKNDREFELFWSIYPHRLGKKLNKKTTMRVFRRLDRSDIQDVLKAVENFASVSEISGEFTQNPYKWLSEENWKEYLQ